MENFESGPQSGDHSKKAESLEDQSHLVTQYEFDVDLEKPDRADEFLMELETGSEHSKLVGEIESLDDRISIIYTNHLNARSFALLMSTVTGVRQRINPGTECRIDEAGECIVKFNASGQRITIYSETEESSYVLHADEVPVSRYQLTLQPEAPEYEDYYTDPDM